MHGLQYLGLAAVAATGAVAQLNELGTAAGMKYFGAATDSPGQRERAGLEDSYAEYDAILKDTKEFGQLTPTNGMKWLFTEPEQGVFNFTEGDIVAPIANETGQMLRCHALVWHSQLAPWVDANTTVWTAANLTEAIETHINGVMAHWKGQCYAWDVVNEALNEDGTYRDSVFYRVLGEDYIPLAFKLAAAADPDAKLYYNDYNLESVGPKSKKAVEIAKDLKAKGIKIDGIGMQAHFIAHQAPSRQDMLDVITMYGEAGVETAMTELDVRLEMPVNDTNLAWQKQVYSDAAFACASLSKTCVGITLWDFYDPFSWVPYVFEGEGAPSLWFANFTKHPAYDGIVDSLKSVAAAKGAGKKMGGDEEKEVKKEKPKAEHRRSSNRPSLHERRTGEKGTEGPVPRVLKKRFRQEVRPVAQAVAPVHQGSKAGPAGKTFPGMRQTVTRVAQWAKPMAQGVRSMAQGVAPVRQVARPMAQQPS